MGPGVQLAPFGRPVAFFCCLEAVLEAPRRPRQSARASASGWRQPGEAPGLVAVPHRPWGRLKVSGRRADACAALPESALPPPPALTVAAAEPPLQTGTCQPPLPAAASRRHVERPAQPGGARGRRLHAQGVHRRGEGGRGAAIHGQAGAHARALARQAGGCPVGAASARRVATGRPQAPSHPAPPAHAPAPCRQRTRARTCRWSPRPPRPATCPRTTSTRPCARCARWVEERQSGPDSAGPGCRWEGRRGLSLQLTARPPAPPAPPAGRRLQDRAAIPRAAAGQAAQGKSFAASSDAGLGNPGRQPRAMAATWPPRPRLLASLCRWRPAHPAAHLYRRRAS